MSMRLTKRDFDVLDWIHQCGFVTIEQIATWLSINESTAYKRIKKLVEHNYLIHERITYTHGIYYVSRSGVKLCRSALPVLRNIVLSTYHHDLKVVSVAIQLVKQLGGHFVTERELRHQQGLHAFGSYTHVSDGDFLCDDKRFAIEVELTKKSHYRRDKIFHHYQKQFGYDAVWYFCGNSEVKNQLLPYAEKVDWLKLYDLEAFLSKRCLDVKKNKTTT